MRLWGPRARRLVLCDAAVLLLFCALSVSLLFLPGRARGRAGEAKIDGAGGAVTLLQDEDGDG